MNPAPANASRPVKHPVFADFFTRDFQRRFAASEDQLLRRWERVAKETARD